MNALRRFWKAFKEAYRAATGLVLTEKEHEPVQGYRDTGRINFLSIFVQKLNNLVNTEATFELESDSVQARALEGLVEDLNEKRFDFTGEMLASGECWVFPSTDSTGKLYHRYLSLDDVMIISSDGERATDVIGIIDKYADDNGRIYFLNRRHTLEPDGKLIVETYVTNEENKRCHFKLWEDLESVYAFVGAGHIGLGRFKSPVSSRGKSPVYGVPLNFGCGETERAIFTDLDEIEKEFKNARSILFADPLILRNDLGGTKGWSLPENLFPIDTRGGQSGNTIDIFSPSIRYSQFRDKLFDDMRLYEQQVGTDRGFLTPFESGGSVTATEIRRANASTIALIDKIRTALAKGIRSVIAADSVFLGVSPDLYSVSIDWFDVFTDEEAQYNRLANAVDRGVAEKSDEMKWLFPTLTAEEREEKLERIQKA